MGSGHRGTTLARRRSGDCSGPTGRRTEGKTGQSPDWASTLGSARSNRSRKSRSPYPVTTAGRVVGVILMIGGVGLFGIFTGFVSSLVTGLGQMRGGRKILSEERAIRAQEDVILERETTIESELQKLTHTVAELQREIRGLQESNLRLTERLGGR